MARRRFNHHSDIAGPQHAVSALTRRTALVGLGAGGVGLLLATRSLSLAGAQDATPAPMGAVGVTIQLMGGGQPTSAPGLELTLRRTTIAPGGRLPAHSHPGAHVIVVEAGTWGYTPLGGTAQLTRAGATGTPTFSPGQFHVQACGGPWDGVHTRVRTSFQAILGVFQAE